ncbi:MAG: hypothetical protein QW372_01595 [Nitrososphaerales archaeon]
METLPSELQRKLMRRRTIIELDENDWQIIEQAMREQKEAEKVEPPEKPPVEQPTIKELSFSISLERGLRDYLAYNPSLLGEGFGVSRKRIHH